MSTPAVTKPVPTAPAPPSKQAAAPATTTATPAKRVRKPSNIPENETQEQTFKRLCIPRVNKALKVCQQLKNLARFKATEAQRTKVFTAIREALTLAETSWKGSQSAGGGFEL